jgi:hypothetical protein
MKLHIVCLLAGFLLFVLSAAAQTASSGSTSSQGLSRSPHLTDGDPLSRSLPRTSLGCET